LKVGLVVPSHGLGGSGEAERRCRLIAERLAERHVVERLTATAASGGKGEHDAVVAFDAASPVTAQALAAFRGRAVLVPLTPVAPEAEGALVRAAVSRAAATLFDTEEERDLLARFVGHAVPGEVVGTGVEEQDPGAAVDVARRLPPPGTYLFHAGPLAPSGGRAVLVDWFLRYQRDRRAAVTLVLAGEGALALAENVHVRYLPPLAAGERLAAAGGALAVAAPGLTAGLDRSVLEAWRAGRPVLAGVAPGADGGWVGRAGGGLWYASYSDFAGVLDALLGAPALGEALGRQGRTYFEARHAWPVVLGAYERLLARAAGAAAA
jgi:glycosyltransferase involved in cell wall biosynthesis